MSEFNLYLGGAEEPGWRRLLVENGVKNIALSYRHLHRRLPKTKPFSLAAKVPEGVAVFLDSAAHNAHRNDDREHSLDLLEPYVEFVKQNLDRLTLFSEFDAVTDLDWVQRQREEIWNGFPAEQFLPIWHAHHGLEELRRLADTYPNVGVPRSGIDARLVVTLRSLADRTRFHAIGEADPDVLKHAFASASTHSWLSATKYGETIVWVNNRLKRYPAKMKDTARRRHRTLFEKAGFDSDAIAADDNAEVARFTVWSFLRLEEHLDRHGPGPANGRANGASLANTENGSAQVAGLPPAVRNSRLTLPVLSGGAEDTPELVRAPVRRCASCHVAGSCPAFEMNAECAYDIPVEVKTKEQLLGLLQGVIEMQTQRVAFTRYAEELEGGYPDGNLSIEMDRLMRIIGQAKAIQDDRDFLTISVQAHAGAGVLSRIFGQKDAEPVHQLQRQLNPGETDHLMASVIDGEVVESGSSNGRH